MREIKFRIWDKDLKKMRICGTNIHDSMYFDQEGNALYYNLQNGCGSLPDGGGTYELMQFTNLLDKNGKEIYEGDILECEEFSFYETNKKVRSFVHYNEYAEWSFGGSLLSRVFRKCEVIGNIYEHPHLLEGGASE